jgi:hypothetical protein
MSDLTAVPGRLFILGNRLTVDIVDALLAGAGPHGAVRG